MGLESATFLNGLVATNPVGATDSIAQGDDHIRLLKSVLLATFPNASAAINPTPTEFNKLVGATVTLESLRGLGYNGQAGSYVIAASDGGGVIVLSAGTTITVPTMPIGFCCLVINNGSGAMTITKSGGAGLFWFNGGNGAAPTGNRTLNKSGVAVLLSDGTNILTFGVGLS